MLITAIIAVMMVAALGLISKVVLSVLSSRGTVSDTLRISVVEFVIAFLVAAAAVTPITLVVGESLSVDAILTNSEFYDGVEVPPVAHETECYAGHADPSSTTAGGSNCHWTHVTGRYLYPDESCTGSGKDKVCVDTSQWIDIHTPYASREYTYEVTDSLGQAYTYPDTYVANDAKPYSGAAIPGNIHRGAPADWLEAKARSDAHRPRPTTGVFSYKNPIIALKKQKGIDWYDDPPPEEEVQGYVSKRLIPDHTANILTNPIKGGSNGKAQRVADKASFVCTNVPDQQSWQDGLMQFNAQLGMKLQGDLHLVIVGGCISNLHEYTKAVKAYWQGPHFGSSPLSKNGIVVVLQTFDGKTIEGADATTGMPFGNNGMLNSIRTFLPGMSLSPRDVLGDPQTVVNGKDTQYTESSPAGSLEDIMLFGQYKFYRICMISCPPGEHSYGDLIAQIEPSMSAKVKMVVIIGGISIIFWLIVAGTDFLDRLWERWFGLGRHRHYNRSSNLDDLYRTYR